MQSWWDPCSTFRRATEETTSESEEYRWLTYDLLVNTLEGHLGKWSLEWPQVNRCFIKLSMAGADFLSSYAKFCLSHMLAKVLNKNKPICDDEEGLFTS